MKTNWQTKKLGEVCNVQTGKWDANHAVENGKYRFYTCAYEHMFCNTKRFLGECLILPGNGVNVGEVFYYNGEFDAYQRTYVISDIKIFPKFLYYHLFCFWKERNLHKQFGSATNFLKIGNFSDYEISYPESPLEQKRIVKILDEVFKNVEKAKENAEKNLQNSKELFESYLQNVFANPGKDWEEKKLGEVCSLITKGSSPKWQGIKYVEEPGILFVTSENIGDGQLILEKIKYVEEKFNKKDKKSILKKGDVLTNIVGASIGRTAIFDLDVVANINQAVCILRCKDGVVFNKYLMNLLNSPFLKIILHNNEVNTARANLSLGFFSNLSIPFPLLLEQKSIVKKIDALSEQTKKLEEVYKKKLTDLEELKKSILSKAFKGEL